MIISENKKIQHYNNNLGKVGVVRLIFSKVMHILNVYICHQTEQNNIINFKCKKPKKIRKGYILELWAPCNSTTTNEKKDNIK